ncbi:polysaccharide deacetylase family protein [Nonomuraea sp. 3-1Str]|uniref:polysaccharide deacetylase family protein n=1 Tax=Nonomuraea sp. 3-1Str TaxID=2929801 RepID=UPI00286144EF|nr:polysaccharide deacetylase family protein [Nonomuraea sp. 3-1Str]MDR8407463.1 polysaccharide deacetylase family protein [Nonomuraea sp. 3-1Str]
MHKLRHVGGLALLGLMAGGCGLGSGSHERNIVVPSDPTLLHYVDPATVGGLVPRTLSGGESARRYVHISYPRVEGAPKLDQALNKEAERQLHAFSAAVDAASSDALRPRAGGARAVTSRASAHVGASLRRPELNVQWDLTAASPDVVGVRLRTGEYLGVGWARSTRTLWYDRRRDRAVGSAGLLAGKAALGETARLVRQGLEPRGSTVDLSSVKATDERLDSMAFNRAGDLVVEFDDCEIGSCSLGRVAVAVPAWQVEPLLSATGRLAQAAAMSAPRTANPIPSDPEEEPGGSPMTSGITPRRGAGPGVGAGTRAGAGVEAAVPAGPAAERVNCAETKCVALTFDDGPGPDTPRLLDALRAADARATFFAVGVNAVADPSVLRRMHDEGHLVANHSWGHRDLTKMPVNRVVDGLTRAQDAITAGTGRVPALARPPYGAASTAVLDAARRVGVALVGWDVDARDAFDRPGTRQEAGEITRRVVGGAHDDAIVLMHDTNSATVDAVPGILKELRRKGYTFVTVPELYGSAGMEAGHFYRSGITVEADRP